LRYLSTSRTQSFSYTFNEGKTLAGNHNETGIQGTLNLSRTATNGKSGFENKGQGLLYARIIMTGTPAAGNEKSSESNLILKVEYRNMDGSPLDVIEA